MEAKTIEERWLTKQNNKKQNNFSLQDSSLIGLNLGIDSSCTHFWRRVLIWWARHVWRTILLDFHVTSVGVAAIEWFIVSFQRKHKHRCLLISSTFSMLGSIGQPCWNLLGICRNTSDSEKSIVLNPIHIHYFSEVFKC